MSTNKDGGPAFPREHNAVSEGMTLRDYFAAHAPEVPGSFMRDVVRSDGQEWLENDIEWRTRWAWVYADAMLKTRGA